jgi:membrane associated rhomboid family serine protease
MEETARYLASYSWAMLPIVLGHVVIPPLYYFRGQRPPHEIFPVIYACLPRFMVSEEFVVSLALNLTKSGYQPYQWLTHIFVHADYPHLLNNLMAACTLSGPVFKEFGAQGLYFLFLSGGLIASAQRLFKDTQVNGFTSLWRGVVRDIAGASPITEKISTKLGNMTQKLSSRLFTKSCGSSGAVCALLGCEFALVLRDVSIIVYNVGKAFIEGPPRDINAGRIYSVDSLARTTIVDGVVVRNASRDPNSPTVSERFAYALREFQMIRGLRLMGHVYTLVGSYTYIQREGSELFHEFENVSNFSERMAKAWDLASVNHLAHFQGALYGIAFGAVFGWLVPAVKSYYRLR